MDGCTVVTTDAGKSIDDEPLPGLGTVVFIVLLPTPVATTLSISRAVDNQSDAAARIVL